MSQFRCGILPLRVETGRFKKPKEKVEDRLCIVCNSSAIEDETHFMFTCIKYSDLRETLFTKVAEKHKQFLAYQNFEKFKFLFSYFPRATAKYLATAFQRRRETLYN